MISQLSKATIGVEGVSFVLWAFLPTSFRSALKNRTVCACLLFLGFSGCELWFGCQLLSNCMSLVNIRNGCLRPSADRSPCKLSFRSPRSVCARFKFFAFHSFVRSLCASSLFWWPDFGRCAFLPVSLSPIHSSFTAFV